MRYLVTARVLNGRRAALAAAIDSGDLGRASIAGDEYQHNMAQARELPDGRVVWVETCFCAIPLDEERPYWEEYFELVKVQDAHSRAHCRDESGEEPWACSDCDCTVKLEAHLTQTGGPFLDLLREVASG